MPLVDKGAGKKEVRKVETLTLVSRPLNKFEEIFVFSS